jgi:hypothetical protein
MWCPPRSLSAYKPNWMNAGSEFAMPDPKALFAVIVFWVIVLALLAFVLYGLANLEPA